MEKISTAPDLLEQPSWALCFVMEILATKARNQKAYKHQEVLNNSLWYNTESVLMNVKNTFN